MTANEIDRRIDTVRRFNRFYTRQIGVLTKHYLQSPFSVIEARVIYELAQHEPTTATDLSAALDMDAGQLSRMLRSFKKQGLVDPQSSPGDGRKRMLSLTASGREAFSMLNARSQAGIAGLLAQLSSADQVRLTAAMDTIQDVLDGGSRSPVSYILRPPRPGDLGWVVQLHGSLYAEEYGWGDDFEALVAGIVADYARQHNPLRERCWIAEMDGENVGSVFVVKKSETEAKLRLLLVAPRARGLGLGKRLVEECIQFSRQAGYRKLVLWTNSVLTAARHIYAKTGFRLVVSEPNLEFSRDLVSETWELDLK